MLERISADGHGTLPANLRLRRPLLRRRSRRVDWQLTRESFDQFLRWLSPDREEAGRKHEEVRRALIRLFVRRGCYAADELFDRTVDRVCKQISLGAAKCVGNPIAFCHGVAKNILREYFKEPQAKGVVGDVAIDLNADPAGEEREMECLDFCLARLSPDDRVLITRYYEGDGRERIQIRKQLALEAGGMNALRLQVFRIRAKLRQQISEELRKRPKQ